MSSYERVGSGSKLSLTEGPPMLSGLLSSLHCSESSPNAERVGATVSVKKSAIIITQNCYTELFL